MKFVSSFMEPGLSEFISTDYSRLHFHQSYHFRARDTPKPLRQDTSHAKTAAVSRPRLNNPTDHRPSSFAMELSSDEDETCSGDATPSTTDSDERVLNDGLLETITEEDQDRITGSSVQSSEGRSSRRATKGPEITRGRRYRFGGRLFDKGRFACAGLLGLFSGEGGEVRGVVRYSGGISCSRGVILRSVFRAGCGPSPLA